jgi:FkbM family methyltransferase
MQTTTKIKLFLKKNLPPFIFRGFRYIADRTILKLLPLFFNVRTTGFSKPYLKKVTNDFFTFTIEIDPKNGYLDKQVHVYGRYEDHIVQAMQKHITKGSVCVDIGANIGVHSISMSHFTGEQGVVHAFEPIPYLREQMSRSLNVNFIKNVQIHPEALSNKKGEETLFLKESNIGSSTLEKSDDSKTIKVNLTTLDSFNFKDVAFIKLDVEGHEYYTLQGGEHMITKCRPIVIFEWSPEYYRDHNKEHIELILSFFLEKEYRLYDLENKDVEVKNIESFVKEFSPGLRSQTNILALP